MGLNWLGRQCSGAILRSRYWEGRGISDQLLKKSSVTWGYYYYDDDDDDDTTTTTWWVTKNKLLWTEKNHEAGVVLRFALCTPECDLDNLWCSRFIFPQAVATPWTAWWTEEKLPEVTNYGRCKATTIRFDQLELPVATNCRRYRTMTIRSAQSAFITKFKKHETFFSFQPFSFVR